MKIKEQKRENYAQSISELALPRHPLRLGIHRGPLWSNGLDEFEPASRQSSESFPTESPCAVYVLILTQPLPSCYYLSLNQPYWQKCPPSYHLMVLSFRLDPHFVILKLKRKANVFLSYKDHKIALKLDWTSWDIVSQTPYFQMWKTNQRKNNAALQIAAVWTRLGVRIQLSNAALSLLYQIFLSIGYMQRHSQPLSKWEF